MNLLAITLTLVFLQQATVYTETITVQLRHADGQPVISQTAQVYQTDGPQNARLAGECVTGADGRCVLTYVLTAPVTDDPELRFTGLSFAADFGLHGSAPVFIIPPLDTVDAPFFAFIVDAPNASGVTADEHPEAIAVVGSPTAPPSASVTRAAVTITPQPTPTPQPTATAKTSSSVVATAIVSAPQIPPTPVSAANSSTAPLGDGAGLGVGIVLLVALIGAVVYGLKRSK